MTITKPIRFDFRRPLNRRRRSATYPSRLERLSRTTVLCVTCAFLQRVSQQLGVTSHEFYCRSDWPLIIRERIGPVLCGGISLSNHSIRGNSDVVDEPQLSFQVLYPNLDL